MNDRESYKIIIKNDSDFVIDLIIEKNNDLNRKELKIEELEEKIGRLNNKINNDLEEFNDKLNTFKWLENDFKEHSIHYYQLECLVEYLKQLNKEQK